MRADEDYRKAVATPDSLAVKGKEILTVAENGQLEIFTTLIEDYEKTYYSIEVQVLIRIESVKLKDENGMSPSDLGHMLGDHSLGYRILSGERKLSRGHGRY